MTHPPSIRPLRPGGRPPAPRPRLPRPLAGPSARMVQRVRAGPWRLPGVASTPGGCLFSPLAARGGLPIASVQMPAARQRAPRDCESTCPPPSARENKKKRRSEREAQGTPPSRAPGCSLSTAVYSVSTVVYGGATVGLPQTTVRLQWDYSGALPTLTLTLTLSLTLSLRVQASGSPPPPSLTAQHSTALSLAPSHAHARGKVED